MTVTWSAEAKEMEIGTDFVRRAMLELLRARHGR